MLCAASCATIREEEYCIESETCTLTGSEFYSDAEETIENLAALVQGGGAHGGESLEDEEQDGAGPLVSAARPLKGVQRLRKRHSNFSIVSSFSLAESTSPSLSSLCSRALARGGSRVTASRGLGKNMAVLQVSNEPDVRISYTSALPPLPSFYLPDKIPDVFLIVNTIDRARTTDDWIDLKRAEQQNNELLEQHQAAACEAPPRGRRPRATRQHTCLASGNERPAVPSRVRIRRRRAQSFDSLLKHLSLWSRASTMESELTRPESTLTRHTLFSPTQQRAGGSQAGNHVSSGGNGTHGVSAEQSTQVTVTISLPHSNRKKTLQVRIPRRLPRRATQESLSDPPLGPEMCSSMCRRESATSSQLTGARGAADSSAGTSLTSLLATPIRSWVWSSAMKRHLRSLGIFSEEQRAEPIASEAAPLLLRAHSSAQHPPPPSSTPLDTSSPAAASPPPPANENTTPNRKARATGSNKPPAATACCRLS